jgi:hypothetical protein
MTQSKTVYGIEEHIVKGLPEARGKMRVLKTSTISHLLDCWDFRYAVIHMPLHVFAFFPTEEDIKRHIDEAVAEVGRSYLKNFNFKGV